MLHAPQKIGLISNPLSQRNKAMPGKLQSAAASNGNVTFASLERMDALNSILQRFSEQGIGVIAIDGGDGTVQAVLTALFRNLDSGHASGRPLPHLCILPGGMTNLIAQDVGPSGHRKAALDRLASIIRDGTIKTHLTTRQVMRVNYGERSDNRYGMFFGAGAVPPAIMMCRRVIHPLNIKGTGAVALTILGLLMRHGLFGKNEGQVFRGRTMRLTFHEGGGRDGEHLLVLASTLDRLALKTNPFWGAVNDGVKITAIGWPPRRLVRSLPRLLFGDHKRRLNPDTYTSASTARAELHLDEPFTLDGEMYTPKPGTPVILEDAGPISFVKW